jgi:type II secretory pathway pseudopilin PulG
MRARRGAEHGFMLVALMFAVAIIGITLATVGVVWSTQTRREREVQLLWVGDQYRAAINRYRGSGGAYPLKLADLVEDSRYPVPKRYLRRLYPDPMTGQTDWQLIPAPGGTGIMGVASSSQQAPIKQTNFDAADAAFDQAQCYCDWQFIAVGSRNRWGRIPVPASNPQRP